MLFSNSLRTIVRSMDELPHDVRLNPRYEAAQFQVLFAGNLVLTEVNRMPEEPSQGGVGKALECVSMAMLSLRSFLKVAETILVENKPLPSLPSSPEENSASTKQGGGRDDSNIQECDGHGGNSAKGEGIDKNCDAVKKPTAGVSPIVLESETLVNAVKCILESPTDETSDHAPTASDETDTICNLPVNSSISKKKQIRNRGRLLVKRIARRRHASVLKAASVISQLASSSSSTLLNSDDTLSSDTSSDISTSWESLESPKESFSSENKEREAEVPYIPRQSAFYYTADPYCGTDVEMPIPTGDSIAVRLDHKGEMKAASMTALVRILTSKESVLDPDFIALFFISFRFFSSPKHFLEALIRRYDEEPPADLNSQQFSVWVRSHMNAQIRVGRAILMWLDVYWKQDDDDEVLEDLQNFVLDRFVGELPEGMVDQIIVGIDRVWEPMCRRDRRLEDVRFIYTSRTGAPPFPINHFPITKVDTSLPLSEQLMIFNGPQGREEFARQLTIPINHKLGLVDPEDAIKYWQFKDDAKRKEEIDRWEIARILKSIIEFERALCSWVTFSVLEEHTVAKRRMMLEFWTDIAIRCLNLRNFSGANCILNGLSSGAITRLKHTVLSVDALTKQHYRTLQDYFSGQDNYVIYREALSVVEPTVQVLAPLIRDVISVLSVLSTSIGATDNSSEKNMINLCSYRVILKTVRSMCMLSKFLLLSGLNVIPTCSADLEPKDQSLNSIHEPWKYTVKGSLNAKYTLVEVPAPDAKSRVKKRQ
ncbi:hypothetical protein H0H81_007939, partial [Sphagnurus paluster]